jgi:hypothetical protein
MFPDLTLNISLAFPRIQRSGIESETPSLQWRDRAGLSPASILASEMDTIDVPHHPKNTKLLFIFHNYLY